MDIMQRIKIIRTLNACLDLGALSVLLSSEDWTALQEMVENGRLCFSGDPTGFHIKDEPAGPREAFPSATTRPTTVIDCATTVRDGSPVKAAMARGIVELVQWMTTCADAFISATDANLMPIEDEGGRIAHEVTGRGVVLRFEGIEVLVSVTVL